MADRGTSQQGGNGGQALDPATRDSNYEGNAQFFATMLRLNKNKLNIDWDGMTDILEYTNTRSAQNRFYVLWKKYTYDEFAAARLLIYKAEKHRKVDDDKMEETPNKITSYFSPVGGSGGTNSDKTGGEGNGEKEDDVDEAGDSKSPTSSKNPSVSHDSGAAPRNA